MSIMSDHPELTKREDVIVQVLETASLVHLLEFASHDSEL